MDIHNIVKTVDKKLWAEYMNVLYTKYVETNNLKI